MQNNYGLKSGVMLALVTMAISGCTPATAVPGAETKVVIVREEVQAPTVCNACGTISSIFSVQDQGKGTGVGAVIGGLVGGFAGSQVGGGDGKKIATVAGVIGGAVVGNKIEGDQKDASYYEIVIEMDEGGQRSITVPVTAGLAVGSKVFVNGNDISLQ